MRTGVAAAGRAPFARDATVARSLCVSVPCRLVSVISMHASSAAFVFAQRLSSPMASFALGA